MKSRARVLVVDDEQLMRRLVRTILVREGYSVATAPGATEALEKLNRTRFDIVITDLQMPGSHGFSLVRDIKEHWPGIGVIVMTGFGDADTPDQARRNGADEYVTKPFNEREIQVIVERACWRRMVKKSHAVESDPAAALSSSADAGTPAIARKSPQ